MTRKFTKYPNNYIKASTSELSDKEQELFAFGESVPMEELFDKLREVTGIPELEFDYEVIKYPYGNGIGIKFQSQNIIDKAGFLDLMFKTLYIYTGNNQIFIDKQTGELTYWAIVSFRYDLQSLGSNGSDFMRVWYSDSKGWLFQLAKDRHT
jgi:hypothetical protein